MEKSSRKLIPDDFGGYDNTGNNKMAKTHTGKFVPTNGNDYYNSDYQLINPENSRMLKSNIVTL